MKDENNNKVEDDKKSKMSKKSKKSKKFIYLFLYKAIW